MLRERGALLALLCAAALAHVDGSHHRADFQWPKHGEGDIILDTNIRDWVRSFLGCSDTCNLHFWRAC